MTDKVKHSTSYFHEAIAHAFEMFKNGYEPVMETPFQPRRLGSAFVTEYKPVSESLDGVVNFDIDKMDEALQSERIEIPESLKMEEFDQFMQDQQLTIQQKWEIDDELAVINMTEEQSKAISDRGKEARLKRLHEKYDQSEGDAYYFLTLLEKDIEQEEIQPLPKELLDTMQDLRDKAEANREQEGALNELAEQSQELGMYGKDNGIFDRLVESIESAQNNPEGCVSTIVEVDKEQKLVYTREQLDELYWTDLQEVGYKFGVKGRNRNKLTNAILQAQEKCHA